MKCVICGRKIKGDAAYCQQHQRQLDKAREEERRRKRPKAVKYVCYRGHVVGFFKNGHDKLKPSYVGMSINGIPKGKLINLDEYCEGYTRQQIKNLKATVLTLSRV